MVMRGGCLFFLAFAAFAHAQPGFISIDCGMQSGFKYTDEETGIYYTSDADYIQSGENKEISSDFNSAFLKRQFRNLRSFPHGDRNCYTLKPVVKGSNYLVRASFMYGNYNGEGLPQFDLYLGVNKWSSVSAQNASLPGWTEIITKANTDFMTVCLVNTGSGTPFISALELRLLKNSMYSAVNELQSLFAIGIFDVGAGTSGIVRYPDDDYDRIWLRQMNTSWSSLSTPLAVQNYYPGFEPPSAVMKTAATPVSGSDALYFSWTSKDPNAQFHVYRHFADFQQPNGSSNLREINVCTNSGCVTTKPEYLVATTTYTTYPISGFQQYSCSFEKTSRSILPPILNAFEVYSVHLINQSATDDQDVYAMMDIKEMYGVKRNWMGDPCVPVSYSWEGLNCSIEGSDSPRVISLNLSSSGLRGNIAAFIANLKWVQSLDLSGNNLTGIVPDFLATMSSLTYLNLSGNKLNGSLPSALREKSKSGAILLSIEDNPNLCISESCETIDPCTLRSCNKIRSFVVPLAVTFLAIAVVAFVLLSLIFWWRFKGRRQKGAFLTASLATQPPARSTNGEGTFNLDNRIFTYAEIVSMTRDFQTELGRGGFGTVYQGHMENGTQVAVKKLHQNCEGTTEFKNEADLLMTLHHKNLVGFKGYCAEGTNKALVLEYMSKGDLGKLLSDSTDKPLTWGQRHRIALDVAQGLNYLHNDCNPQIIHRDMKPKNILLNEELEAKIADFGISRVFSSNNNTHISTRVMGTLGYVDPEYANSEHLTTRSDVYSFGVVLLELITGKPVVIQTSPTERMHIVQWVRSINPTGAIDSRLGGNDDISLALKAMKIAIACTEQESAQRPTMSYVVAELNECSGVETFFST